MELSDALDGLGHLVDGELVTTGATFDVIDPSIGEAFTTCPDADVTLVDRAVAAAVAAAPAWAADEATRRDVVGRMIDVLGEHLAVIDDISLRERGSAGGEAGAAVAFGRHVLATPLRVEIAEDSPTRQVRIVRRPVGVVAAIAPWNAPILMIADKIFTALVAGNTVIAKPSPFTPLSTMYLAKLWQPIVPAGVLNILAGGDDIGRAMVANPSVNMVSFTGSVAAGKSIAASAASGLKNLLLELGGNDAAIVLDDANPSEIAASLFRGAFMNTGQICSAIKRLYVHESLYETVVQELAALARDIPLGPSRDAGTLGPLSTRPQYDRVCELVEDALAHGAKAVTGGAPVDGPGYFFPPTILTDVAPGMRIVDEEQFGPVLPVMSFTDVDNVLATVNGGQYGLGGSVWTTDIDRGVDVAGRLHSGSAWINNHPDVGPHIPFGGVKCSGIGRTWGQAGFDAYCELQSVFVPKTGAA